MRHKRKISLVLVAAIFCQPLMASDMFQGYETGSKPQSWTDGSGGKYLYGGNFTYKFKRDTSFKPVLDFAPPGIQAGCNGISLSGGFIHMLGLDEIKQQLQSAGQGAMMGVVVGLIYSLPGIAEAFDKVHKFVRMLQQLLSNSCQITSAAVRSFIDQEKNKPAEFRNGYENAVGSVFGGVTGTAGQFNQFVNDGFDSMAKGLESWMPTTGYTAKSPAIKSGSNCEGTCITTSKEASTIKSFVQNGDASKTIKLTKLELLNDVINNKTLTNAILFNAVFIGYSAVSTFPKETTDKKAAAEVAHTLTDGTGASAISKTYQKGLLYSADESGASVVSRLMSNSTGTITVPNIALQAFYSAPQNADGTIADMQAGVLFGEYNTAKGQHFAYPWKGLLTESSSYLVDVIINNNLNAVPTVPSVFPKMDRYINILRAEYLLNPTQPVYVMSLINLLAEKNAAMLLQVIITEMSGQAGAVDNEKTMKAIEQIQKEIEKLNALDASIADTVSLFEKLEASRVKNVTNKTKK